MFVKRISSLATSTALVALLLFTGATTPQTKALAADNPVVVENQQQGSTGWQINSSKIANDKDGQIKGYASVTSAAPGQSVTFYVSVNPAQTYTIDVYRLGWYNGFGGRLRLHAGPFDGTMQNACTPDATTGLIACNWTPSYTFAVGADWTSGIYYTLLTNAAGFQNAIIFTVKDGRPAAFLYQQSVNTYQAYNNYPDDGVNGKSLYSFNSYGANTISGAKRAVKVSFDRPYAGEGSMYLFTWELNLIRWLERNGYDVTYTTDVDTDANDGALKSHKGFLSAGHDEYWSKGMYDAALAARDAGVNLAFFGSNAIYWQVRYEPSASGAPNRIMVCYKDASIDPVQGATTTINFRDPPVNRPEQALIGVMFRDEVPFSRLDTTCNCYVPNNSPYVVTNSSHWIYAGTGFKDGDSVPGLVGYEMDRYQSTYGPQPPGQVFLSNSPYTGEVFGAEYAQSSIYTAPSGALVFATGTMSWSWGLDNYWYTFADARIQRTTANLLNAFINGAPRTATTLKLGSPTTATAAQSFTVTVSAEDAKGPVPSYAGTVHFASSDSAATLPADATLVNGQGTFTVTLATVGSQTLTVSDTANGLSTTATITVNGRQATTHFALTTTASPVAGTSFGFTVTAQDDLGNTDTAYAGTVHFTTTDTSTGVVVPADATLTNGQGSFAATLIKAGSQTITATDKTTATITGGLSVTVRAASASRLGVTSSTGTPTAGTALSLSVTAFDPYGNVDTAYAGTVHFTTSDTSSGVVLPADSTLTSGQGSFAATLTRAGAQSVTATDAATSSITGTVNVTVGAASASRLGVTSSTGTPTAGSAFSVTVTAFDPYGNTDTAYAGTVHFTSSDISTGVVMPADATLTNGQGSFAATLIKAGPQTITATDKTTASITGAVTVTVRAARASRLGVTSSTGTPTAGSAFSVTVTAFDPYGNVDTAYAGTVHFTSSDTSSGVVLPANGTLANGQRTFSATLTRAGAQSITATDTATSSITGTVNVTVRAAAAASLTMTAPPSVTVNQAFTVTVTANDAYGNLATSYRGSVHFSTSDISPLAQLPADYTFTAADAAAHTFAVILETPPSQTITVVDKANASLTDTKTIAVKLPLL